MGVSSVIRRVRNVLRETADTVVELDYPANYRERSIDFVATLREQARDREHVPAHALEGVVVRISPGKSSGVSSEVEEDLAKFADVIDGIPLVVDDELYDNIVFDYGRIFATNERTLENIMKEKELITLYRRNELYVALNVKLIEKEISRGSLRISDISNTLGLSKKSVETCLKGLGLVSVEKAEKLITQYSSELVMSVGYEVLREVFKKKNLPRPGLIREMGTETLIYSLNKTAVDLVVREAPRERARLLRFYVDSGRTQSVKHVRAKIMNALRLAEEFNAALEVIVPDSSFLELLKKEIESDAGSEILNYIKFSSQSQVRTFQRSST